jgi:hypothetical protein
MFSFCHPYAVYKQVEPTSGSKYLPGSREEDGKIASEIDDDEVSYQPRSLKLKPAVPNASVASSSAGGRDSQRQVEDEIYLFSSELRWKSGSFYEYQQSLLRCQLDVFLFYECNAFSSSSSSYNTKSTLVSVLRNTLSNKPLAYNTASIWAILVNSLTSLNRVLKNYEFNRNNLFATSNEEVSFNRRNPFVSIEHTLMITVSMFVSICRFDLISLSLHISSLRLSPLSSFRISF